MTKLYDDSGSTDSGSLAVTTDIIFGEGPLYQSFTNSSIAATLTTIGFDLDDANPTDGGDIVVDLYDSTGSAPGALVSTLGTILDSSLSTVAAYHTLTVSSAVTLAASTTYWIGLSGSGVSGADWQYTTAPTGTGTSGESSDSQLGVNHTDQFLMTLSANALCFAAGTRILTVRGEVPVEELKEGDLAVGLRAGRLTPVRWVGRKHIDLHTLPNPEVINPVRIRANAFGPRQPHQDLILSPNHALYVDGHFIAVRYLINGATILQEAWEKIDYYHVELEGHEVLLANGMTAESFLDVGNRSAFSNASGTAVPRLEFAGKIWEAEACAPDLSKGDELSELRQTLLERAVSLGHVLTQDSDVRVLAGHATLRPVAFPGGVRFDLPKGTSQVRIDSRCFVPSEVRAAHDDGRKLGIGITSIHLDERDIGLDDERLTSGWHTPEPGLRWTDGGACLRTDEATTLTLMLHDGPVYWTEAPEESRVRLVAA